uniref:TLDc domain-containing protein n=1 Tax=Magallana gigas TaxID=29159 RepID=A0A8W8M3N2_MAGGI|nr:interferon-induced protein 44-like isoform X3 [Crassostrea gigas]
MERSLTRRDKDQISRWIGRDSHFELLYKISRDGGSTEMFHELCDNKGPTVTIFYNTDKNVYGGYVSDSWGSTGGWCTDQRAFLFKLHSVGNWKPVKFPYVTKETHYKNKTHGPVFYSLNSIYSNITTTGKPPSNYYKLDSYTLFDGQRFDMKGETVKSVANGHNNVTDLEVYLVKEGSLDEELDSLWRDSPEWSPQGEMSSRACTGSAESSLTEKFCKFRVRDPTTKKHLCFRICDTRGVEEGVSINGEDLGFLLDGNLPNNYTFQLDSEASTKRTGFVEEPTVKEKMHVVVFVLDGSTLDVLSEGVVSKLKKIKRKVVDRSIPHLVFLTKIDRICKLVEKGVSKTFISRVVEDAVNNAAEIIALPRSQVLPVKNFEKETTLNTDINILAMTALRKSLVFADDFLENQYDWQQDNTQILNKRD